MDTHKQGGFTVKKLTGMMLAAAVIISLATCGNKAATETAAPAEAARTEEAGMEEAKEDETRAETRAEMSDVGWPTGPVSIFVPGRAGASLNTKARLIAKYLSPELGVDVVVDNRPGAGGITACTQYLAEEADSDNTEYTTASNLTVVPIYSDCEFAADDLVTVADLDSVENGLFVDAKLGIRTLEELKAYAGGETMRFANTGVGDDSFLVSKIMMEELGITSDSVNGDGFGDVLVDVMSGSAEVCYCTLNQASQHVEDGSIVPLVVYGERNYAGYADFGFAEVPTLKNAGVNVSYSTVTWFSLRAGTDQAVVEKLAAALQEVYDSPEFQAEFTEAGFVMLSDVSTAAVSKRVDSMIANCAAFVEKIGN